jgi:hypothetical protein
VTRTPTRARGIVDPQTGSLLAMSATRVRWFRGAGYDDITPEHEWGCAAAGAEAVLLAGEGWISWFRGDEQVRAECPYLSRVAVAGELAAGVTDDGTLTVWLDVASGAPAATVEVGFEPDGVAADAGDRRVVVWGWLPDGTAAMKVFAASAGSCVALPAPRPPLSPSGGVAYPLAAGGLAVASAYDVKLTHRDGAVWAALDLPGIERLAGSGDRLAYVRVARPHEGPVVGIARVVPGGLEGVQEQVMPASDDPFPHLTASPDGARLVLGDGPGALLDYRLTEVGWSDPTRYDV